MINTKLICELASVYETSLVAMGKKKKQKMMRGPASNSGLAK